MRKRHCQFARARLSEGMMALRSPAAVVSCSSGRSEVYFRSDNSLN